MGLYERLPVALQNFVVSIRGRTYVRKRYSGRYRWYVNWLMRTQWFSAQQFRQFQNEELKKLVLEAISNTDHYKRTLGKLAAHPDEISAEKLLDIPFVEKNQLRESTEDFVNHDRLRYGYDAGHTSGTSGVPLVWKYDLWSIRHDLAFRERQYRWAGVTGKEASARFGGRLILGKHDGPPYWRHNAAENQWLFSTYHITEKTIPLYYEAMKKIDFAFLDGYPSALFAIARWINTNDLSGNWRPWVVFTTAETLMEFQRQEISKAFGCRVCNFYSSSEGAPFVTTCEAGSMHINPESGIIEFLRPDGTPANPGEDGEMVVTSFFQRTMPLIRFRIGDTGVLAKNQDCPCGRHMPVVERIGGREGDVLFSSERGRIGSAGLSTALYKLPSRLKESQIQQLGKDSFVFRYIPMGQLLTPQEITTIDEELRKRLGQSIELQIEQVELIPKGANGKSRLVVGFNCGKSQTES